MKTAKGIIQSLLQIIFLDQTAITLTFPLLTLIFFDSQSRLFSADTSYAERSLWYGICITLPNIINIFFAPTLSALSDELGRKKILILEIFSAFVFTLLVGLGVYLGALTCIFFGFIIRGAFSRTNPTALAIIGDSAPKKQKVLYMSYLQFAIALGAALGPILGGYFANHFFFSTFNFSLPFFISATLALFNTLFAFFFIHETLKSRAANHPRHFTLRAIKQVFLHPNVLQISLILLCIQLSWSMYYQFMPPILKTLYSFNSHELGWFIGMIAVWLAIATGGWMSIFHRFLTLHQLLQFSLYLIVIGFLITLLACTKVLPHPLFFIWAGAMPIATGDVIAYSCLTALYSNAVAHERQGKVMGMSFIVVAMAWAFTGFLGGLLLSLSPLLPLILAPLGVVVALLLIRTDFAKKLALSYEAS